MPTQNGVYTAAGTYNDAALSPEDRQKVDAFKTQWAAASAAGDRAGMDAAHAGAEGVRQGYGYSGGHDGSQYAGPTDVSSPYAPTTDYGKASYGQGSYSAPKLAGPTDYSQYIRDVQQAAVDANIEALTRAQNTSLSNLDAERAKIGPQYYDARNTAQTMSDQQQRYFNEYAAARGLGTGAAAGMTAASTAALQGGLTDLTRDETAAYTEVERQRTILQNEYASRIAEAQMRGQYDLAQALYGELVRQDNALMQVSQAQANLDFQGAQFDYGQYRDRVGDAQWWAGFDYDKQRDAIANEMALTDMFGSVSATGAALMGRPAGTQTASYGQQEWQNTYQKDLIAYTQAAERWNTSGYVQSPEDAAILGVSVGTPTANMSQFEQQMARAYSSGGGGGSSSGGSGQSVDLNALFANARASGNPQGYIIQNAQSYGYPMSEYYVSELLLNYEAWVDTQQRAQRVETIYDNMYNHYTPIDYPRMLANNSNYWATAYGRP